MDILHISQSTENRNLSMNLKVLTIYLKFYTKGSVHFINHINVKQVPMFLLVARNKIFLPNRI